MRKLLTVLLAALIAFALNPAFCFAQDFGLNGDELTISFDTDKWTVFTRDNLKEKKPELKKLGTTPKQMKSTMDESSSHLVAIKNGQAKREEILVRIHENTYINNMSTLSDKDMKALKKGIKETYGSEIENLKCGKYEANECTWFRMTGNYDEDHLVIQYFTIVNGRDYLVAAQKVVDYTDEDKSELENMIDHSQFTIDDSRTENDLEGYIQEQQESLQGSTSIKTKIFAGIVIVLAVAAALYVKNRKHRRR